MESSAILEGQSPRDWLDIGDEGERRVKEDARSLTWAIWWIEEPSL